MRYVGIDPGKEGAMALLSPGGRLLELIPTPLCFADSKGARSGVADYDLLAIRATLLRWQVEAPLFATVELLHTLPPTVNGRPMGGGKANFARGVAQGWAWMLVGLGIPYQMVLPRAWQKLMHQSAEARLLADPKARSLAACASLFPGACLLRTPRSRKPSDGMADALLLAECGRRTREAQERKLPPDLMDEVAHVPGIGRVE